MNDGKGMSIAALVLGILSAIFAWWGLYIGIVSLVCGIVGIVLAVRVRRQRLLQVHLPAWLPRVLYLQLSVPAFR